jgi:capsular exopolysaccharide synthesis family protein
VVRFASHDPELSAAAVNTIMKLFVDRSYETRHEEIVRSCTWLARQLDDIREKMETSSRQLAEYQHTHGVADVDNASNTVAEQVGDLNKQLADAQAQRIQLEAYLNRVSTGDLLPQMSANTVIQGLTQKQAEVSAELAQARAVYGSNHPNVRKLENQANELERQIRAQRDTVAAEMKTSYSAAQARENLLLGEVRKATAQLSHMEEYTNLKKEAEADRQLYDTLYSKVKEAGIAAASRSSNIHVVDEAPVLDRPTRPHRSFNLLAALLFGLLGGLALAFIKEGLEDRLYTAEEVRQWTGLPSIAVIPVIGDEDKKQSRQRGLQRNGSNGNGRPSHHKLLHAPQSNHEPPAESESRCRSRILIDRPYAPESEALNVLRTVLLLARRESATHVFVVTSPLPGEGKTTVATNLAAALAKRGRTCLVDADLRRPQAATTFRYYPSKGLVELLQGTASLEDALYEVPGVKNLSVLASVNLTPEAAELIVPSKIGPLIRELREMFEFVVIDTPPILPCADGRVLATLADGLIMVNRAAVTPRSAMTRSLELLNEVRSAPILTVVLNAVDFRCPDYHYYYAGYQRS